MDTSFKNAKTQQMQRGFESAADHGRILLADDDLEMRKMLAWSLRENGFEVTECSDGNCLMKRLGFLGPLGEAEAFDLIISDIKMPGVTGMQLLENAKEHGDLPPTILITAFGDEAVHEKARKLGAAAILNKPFELDDLIAKVNQILPLHLRSAERKTALHREELPVTPFPVDIKFRHDSESEPARDLVMGLAAKMNRFESLIQQLHVVIDQSNPEDHRKHRYLVTITVDGPGKRLVAKCDSDKDNNHANLYLAIQIAFAALYRQVSRYHKRRNSHKTYPAFTDDADAETQTDKRVSGDKGVKL